MQLMLKIADLELWLVYMKTGRGYSQWFCSQYCMHLLRSAYENRFAALW